MKKIKYLGKSHRWQCWDYSNPGTYFLTICVKDFKHIFGKIVNAEMILSPIGEIIAIEIKKIPTYHQRIILDEWVIMPNHVHLLINLQGDDYDNGLSEIKPTHYIQKDKKINIAEQWKDPQEPKLMSKEELADYYIQRRKMLIPMIMSKFKQQTSKEINILNKVEGVANWHEDYHDHIVKNLYSYFNIKNYIIENPKRWEEDRFNQ